MKSQQKADKKAKQKRGRGDWATGAMGWYLQAFNGAGHTEVSEESGV